MAFDTSEYRQDTYGSTPDYYCDVTRSLASSGAGTLGDPYNLNQAMGVAGGSLVWCLPVGSGTPVQLAAPASANTPAFNVTNSGVSAANPTVFVTKYAASYLVATGGKSNIGTDQNRTELRHAGAAATIDAGGAGGTSDTGGPIIGANGKNHIVFDGFYIDIDECEIREDSGVIRTQGTTGIKCRNFAIKGKTVGVASNCVIYRPGNTVDDELSNFYVWGFKNSATAGGNTSATPQPALFSDQYGSQNFLIEHFDIDDCDRGIFCKGSAAFDLPNVLNYGTIRYGRITRTSYPVAFNAMATTVSNVSYCLFADTWERLTEPDFAGDGIQFDTISPTQIRNVNFDHITMAKVENTGNTTGAFVIGSGGAAAEPNGIKLTNSILDIDTGSNVFLISVPNTNDLETCNYNYYRRPNGILFSRNGSNRTFAQWQSDSGLDTNSDGTTNTDPFNNRASDDYTINTSHAAYTMSSTGGQVGCYATTETVGVEYTGASPGGSGAVFGPVFLL